MKFKVILLIILLTYSCKSEKYKNMRTLDGIQEQNVLITKQLFLHFNNHNWQEMANMYPERAEIRDPSLGLEIVQQTRHETIEKYRRLNEIFPNIHDTIVNIYPSGKKHVIVEFVSTGTASDGTVFKLPICTIMTIENGIITKAYTYYDNFDEEHM